MNVFGENWTFTSFGESHGAAIGGVLDGVPAGLHIDFEMVREELERRAGKAAGHAPLQSQGPPKDFLCILAPVLTRAGSGGFPSASRANSHLWQ